MNLLISPEALTEIEDALKQYEEIRVSLGMKFLNELHSSFTMILEFPEAFTPFEFDARMKLLRNFPYALFYIIESQSIRIVAVSHTHRKPYYWKNRL